MVKCLSLTKTIADVPFNWLCIVGTFDEARKVPTPSSLERGRLDRDQRNVSCFRPRAHDHVENIIERILHRVGQLLMGIIDVSHSTDKE